jgi:iron donor protein CyaY
MFDSDIDLTGERPQQRQYRVDHPSKGDTVEMTEQEFKTRADEALSTLYKRLAEATDRYEFEPDFNAGALAIEFDEPKGKIVISPNAPVRQVWISAHSKSFKLGWNDERQAFVLTETGQTLADFIAGAIGQHLDEEVTL